MIISCIQCHKKFEIDSNLIPKSGRLLECGSCNHKWFYKEDIQDKTEETVAEPQLKNIEENNISPVQSSITQIDELDDSSKKKIIKTKKIKKISFLNIIIVFIISFGAFVIIIETFKDPISIIVPNIEFILNSLYEIIKDIILFIKDLIK